MTGFTTIAWVLESTLALAVGLALASRAGWSASARHAALAMAIVTALLLPAVSVVAGRSGWGVLAPMPSLVAADQLAVGAPDTDSSRPPCVRPLAHSGVSRRDWVGWGARINGDAPGPRMAQPVSEDHRPSISGASVDTDGLRPAATSAAGWTAGSSWTVAARWTIGAWIALSVATFIRLNIGIARGIAIRRTTRPADDGPLHVMLRRAVAEHGVRRRVELRVSDAVECPAVWCWLRPCVILPQSIDRPHVDWRAVLAHEVAHLARRDHLTAMAAELLVCMLPWHPLSWIARRWLAELAEEACDDWAMGSARDATEYAASLLSFRPAHRGAMLAIVSGSSVSARVRRILHDLAGDTRIGRRLAVGGPVIAALALAIAAVARPGDAVSPSAPVRAVDNTPRVHARVRTPDGLQSSFEVALVDSSRRLPDGTTTDLSDGQREHVALRLRGWDEQVIRARIARCNRTLRVNVTDGFGEAAVGRFVTIRYLLDPLGFETKSLQGPEQVVPDSGMVEFTGVPTSDVAEVLLEVNGTVDLVSFDPASPAIVEHTLSLAPTIGRRAPDVTLTGAADGHPFRLSSLRGRVVLLEFWATWCGPCQPAMTRTNEMAGRRSDRGDRVAVVGVSTDDALDKVAGHVKKRNWNASLQTWGGPHVNGGSPVSRAFGIRGIPHAFLIDGGGTLRWAGHPDDVDLEKEIDRLVREAR